MLSIIIIFISILIIDHVAKRLLIKKYQIVKPKDTKYTPINKIHGFIDTLLRIISFIIVMVAFIEDIHWLKPFVFVPAIAIFVIRAIVDYRYKNHTNEHILNAITCSLFIIGVAIYGIFFH
ncbi:MULTISPECIES: DUF4181 domain-containing protein [Bacillaceae]|uniref:DUF4181 domain-containing protein n=1 Tax=Evansella alkalicola TaxID=745819 RepID=A0ABS6JZD2_9BACI|nr:MULTISPECIES: DUF4181 domain-containing protein [Bacillaceae]MBU9723044.1 DUF4181 domain-containing protein [Bacillus alkalicola]